MTANARRPDWDYRETPHVRGLKGINRTQRVYLKPSGSGFTCLGFDVAHRQTTAVAQWLKRDDLLPPARKGTVKAWKAHRTAMKAGAEHSERTGQRCNADLNPALIGLEGRRVEVKTPAGDVARFWVGKSMGWLPIHLEISRRDSTGGGMAYVPPGSRVTVVSDARR